jgi:hypothetical protein
MIFDSPNTSITRLRHGFFLHTYVPKTPALFFSKTFFSDTYSGIQSLAEYKNNVKFRLEKTQEL